MGNRVDWRRLMRGHRESPSKALEDAQRRVDTREKARRRKELAKWVLRADATLAVLFIVWLGSPWVVSSPLFIAFGSLACFVLLVLCVLLGVLFRCVTTSEALLTWAIGILPFGVAGTFRSALGMILAVVLMDRILRLVAARLCESERSSDFCSFGLYLGVALLAGMTLASVLVRLLALCGVVTLP